MAEIIGKPTVVLTATLRLNESELRALDALVGYGDDAFVKAFYETLGAAYMKAHEGGLRQLFQSARGVLPGMLRRAEEARRIFDDAAKGGA